MNINIVRKENERLNDNELNIEVQYSSENSNLQSFIEYINDYRIRD